MALAEDIKEARKKRGHSMADVSQLIGIKSDKIYKWEKGTKPSDPEDLAKIKDYISGGPAERANPVLENTQKSPEEDFRAKYIKQIEKENQFLQNLVTTNLTLVLATVRTISIRQEATGGVVLESLARIEKKPEAALVAAGDKRRDQIMRDAHARGSEAELSR